MITDGQIDSQIFNARNLEISKLEIASRIRDNQAYLSPKSLLRPNGGVSQRGRQSTQGSV